MKTLQVITFPIVIMAVICGVLAFISHDYFTVGLAIVVSVGHLLNLAPTMVVTSVILGMGTIQLASEANPIIVTLLALFTVAYVILTSINVFHLCIRIFLRTRAKKTNLQKK